MQRTYELMFILRPDLADEEVERVISTVDNQVTSAGGTVRNVERMGKRRLAYKVRKFQDGMYMLFVVEGPGAIIREVERRLRVTEPVIKFISVRVDEEQKRLEKIRRIRASRRRASASTAAVSPEAASEAAGPETSQVTA